MAPMLTGFRGSQRFIMVGPVTAGLFLAYLIALSPHLVHHFFDEDQGRQACPLLAQSQQTPELQTDPPTLTSPISTERLLLVFPRASSPSPDFTASDPRAPPRSVPSA